MKKCLLFLLALFIIACEKDDKTIKTYDLTVCVSGIEEVYDSCFVSLKDQQANSISAEVDANGMATFNVPAGIYDAYLNLVVEDPYYKTVYNASKTGIVVGDKTTDMVELTVSATRMQTANPLVIKEIYCGGCQKDDGSGKFTNDKCIILYNNSSRAVPLANVAIGMVDPYNAEAAGHSFLIGGTLQYETEDWLPGINGIWYFNPSAEIAPYSELVVAVNGAIDHTLSYSNSVNYAKKEYYCMYDPEAASSDGGHYNSTSYYPSPSEVIPSDHYLKAVKYGKGTAWPMSQFSPAVFIFKTDGTTPEQYASNEDNIIYPDDKQGNLIYACLRVPRSWVIDGVEVFNSNAIPSSKKRMTPDIDNGYVETNGGYSHAVVRKRDEAASAAAGHDVYADTNNSSEDFYEADKCTIM